MEKIIVCENIRSAYNVGNVIRTADCLGWDVLLSWYTPSPDENIKVSKTSLGAHKYVKLLNFRNTSKSLRYLSKNNYTTVCAEITESSQPLKKLQNQLKNIDKLAVILGNEKDWVLKETLDFTDYTVYIDMKWQKDSLNVWQASSIFMRALN